MSPYDDPQYEVEHTFGPLLASFASALLKCTATSRTGSSANVTDRIQFFRKVKLTGARAITRSVAIVGAKPVSHHAFKAIVTEGTRVCATIPIGTVAGVSTAGGISATYATITTGETLQVKLKMTQDGTAATSDQISADIYLRYQECM